MSIACLEVCKGVQRATDVANVSGEEFGHECDTSGMSRAHLIRNWGRNDSETDLALSYSKFHINFHSS
jgi:hypothetical protein